LSRAIRRIPETALAVPCQIGANEPVTLRYLVEDYLVHLRHHLKQIDERRAAEHVPELKARILSGTRCGRPS
jgi:hypothetical protein